MGVKMLNTIPLLTLSMQLFNCLPNPLESRASSFRITTTKTLNCRGTLLECRKATSINTDSLEREIEKNNRHNKCMLLLKAIVRLNANFSFCSPS